MTLKELRIKRFGRRERCSWKRQTKRRKQRKSIAEFHFGRKEVTQ